MKKFFQILSLLLLLSLAVACDPETKPTPTPTPTPTPPPTPPTPAASITFSIPSGSPVSLGTDGNASVEIPAAGGTVTAPFSATVAWSASSNNSWCTVSPASGSAGSVQLSLTHLRCGHRRGPRRDHLGRLCQPKDCRETTLSRRNAGFARIPRGALYGRRV